MVRLVDSNQKGSEATYTPQAWYNSQPTSPHIFQLLTQNSFQNQWRIYIQKFPACAPPNRTKFFHFYICFHRKVPVSEVGTPSNEGWRPPNGKSWIHPWKLWFYFKNYKPKLTHLITLQMPHVGLSLNDPINFIESKNMKFPDWMKLNMNRNTVNYAERSRNISFKNYL